MYVAVLIGLAAFLIFSILAAITFGNADLSLKDVYSVIAYKLFHIKSLSAYAEGGVHDVVWLIRLPRVLLALAVGMALSVCGVVMQAIVQNPLADPYVLGISSGASLGATLAIMLGVGGFLGGNSVGVPAFIGAMVTSFAVIAIANMGGKATSAKLILAGMAVSAVCSAFSNFVIYITNDKNAATEVMKWTMGSLAGASWSRVGVMLPVTLICVIIFWTQYRNLNLMLLGDDVSITLGTDLHRLRTFYLIVASVMIGFAVYCAGVIGFVGLVIPHVIRILFGTDHRRSKVTTTKSLTVKVVGKNGYRTDGTVSKNWGIDKFNLANANVTVDGDKVTVKCGRVDVETSEYTVEKKDGKVTVTAKKDSKNYTGSKTVDAATQDQKPAAPMISSVKVVGNKATAILSGDSEGAAGYDYVISTDRDCITNKDYDSINKIFIHKSIQH